MEIKTADYHREQATACLQRSHDSFERCDTDGFLTQWAAQVTAQQHNLAAKIAENGGVWEFESRRLETLDGAKVEARICQTKYGFRWRIDATDEWLPVAPKREQTLAKRGYREVIVYETHEATVARTGDKWCPIFFIARKDGVRYWVATD